MFADLMMKVINGQALDSQEKEMLRLSFSSMETNNKTLGSWIGVNGNPNFANGFDADGEVRIGKNIISPCSARVKRNSDQAVASGTSATYIQFESVEYNDGLEINLNTDSTKLYIITGGIYNITIGAAWDTTLTSSYGECGILLNGTTSIFPVSRLPGVSGLISTATDERLLSSGDYIQLYTRQQTGISQDVVSSFLTIKKVRSLA